MRIIHTADWHLCDRLGRIDRTKDLETRVEWVAALCEEHTVDVLLIAGDLFSKQASVDDMTQSLNHIREVFKSFFGRGGTVLAITGNHDCDARINMVRAGMTLAVPSAGAGGLLSGGRMYLVNGRAFTTIADSTGDRVQFVLVPYPFASRYELSAGDYRSREEETRLLHAKVAEWVQSIPSKTGFDAALPTVLAAHLHVRGSEMHSLYKMTERDDVLFDFADLNPMWSYVALGHIHKPQALNAANVQYPGSLDRLDFGETHDNHGVLLVDINGPNNVEPQRLRLPATPFHTIELSDPEAELPTLAVQYPDHATAIVKLSASPPRGETSRDEIVRQIRKLFPRLHEFKWADTAPRDQVAIGFTPRNGFEPTVRDYLAEKLIGDPDRDSVLALVESFLKDPGGS
jgi:exonuclease SbcD